MEHGRRPSYEIEEKLKSEYMAVAFIDILGFKNIIVQKPLEEIVRIIKEIITSMKTSWDIVQHDLDNFSKFSGKETPELRYLYFSDTILMWLTTSEKVSPVLSSPAQMVVSLSYAVAILIAYGIKKKIPLRGAIAYGDCCISEYPLFSVGKPIAEAYELEKAQEWAGASISKSAEEQLEMEKEKIRNDFIVEYTIPLKQNYQNPKPMYAVNWASLFKTQICDDISPESKDEDVKNKKKNTMDFFNKFKHINAPISL